MAVTCSGRRRACIHPCGFKDSVALTGPLHHRFTFVFFFARDVRTLDSGIYSSCPVYLAVHCSVSVCRLRSTGFWILLGEDLQKMSVFCAMLGSTAGYMFIRQSPEAVCHFLRESGLGS